jgi:two-component system sensor histidine kinase BaeS
MTLSIAQKLVAAFVGLTLLVLVATLGLARWSFEQGFLDYVNALEQTRLERLQLDLAQEYLAAGGNWKALSGQRFGALLRRSAPHELRGAPPPGGRPPPGMRQSESQRRGPQGAPPTALYDRDDNLIAGESLNINGSPAIRIPIVVDGTIVGELRSEPRRHFSSPQETEFSRQQLKTSWIIGISSLVIAFGVSLLLARGLLAPIRRMLGSVAQLSSGDYSHRMNEGRRDELGQLTRDLDRLGSTLEANQSSRKRLLADVSHELRTPLTVLCGEIEALKDGLREFDQTQLESLDQEVQRLRYLVDDLYELSISDVGGLRYQFTDVDINDCVRHSLDGMRNRAGALGIELNLVFAKDNDATSGAIVSADAQRIDQLIQNILDNSLAYTDTPGRIVMTVSHTATKASITVEDTLPGVNESDCEKLFDPLFRQEASRSRRTGGAGLGLAICRNIVTAHGGSISASPSSLGGLCVHIEIPVSGESNA